MHTQYTYPCRHAFLVFSPSLYLSAHHHVRTHIRNVCCNREEKKKHTKYFAFLHRVSDYIAGWSTLSIDSDCFRAACRTHWSQCCSINTHNSVVRFCQRSVYSQSFVRNSAYRHWDVWLVSWLRMVTIFDIFKAFHAWKKTGINIYHFFINMLIEYKSNYVRTLRTF